MGTKSENQFRAEARDANNEVKGGVISEGVFNLVPSSKKLNQITIPQLFTLLWKVQGEWFGSFSFVAFFWGWNQVENTFWDYPNFKGVYSWLDALGNEHTIAYNSGTVYILG